MKSIKIRYDKEDDVLMVWLSKKKVVHAVKGDNVITHFSPKGEAVLIEILDASKFLKITSQALPKKVREELFAA